MEVERDVREIIDMTLGFTLTTCAGLNALDIYKYYVLPFLMEGEGCAGGYITTVRLNAHNIIETMMCLCLRALRMGMKMHIHRIVFGKAGR